MNYKLITLEPDGGGVRDIRKEIAISNSKEHLEHYCTKILKKKLGKPEKFSWEPYYEIEESSTLIV